MLSGRPPIKLTFVDTKVVYRRYASLFFICGIGPNDNELVTLEIIHRYVEVLDRYFGNVGCFDFFEHALLKCLVNAGLRVGSVSEL